MGDLVTLNVSPLLMVLAHTFWMSLLVAGEGVKVASGAGVRGASAHLGIPMAPPVEHIAVRVWIGERGRESGRQTAFIRMVLTGSRRGQEDVKVLGRALAAVRVCD